MSRACCGCFQVMNGGGWAYGASSNSRSSFQPRSLFETLVMLVLLAGGLGLVARSLRPQAGSD